MDWKDTLLPGATRTPYDAGRFPGGAGLPTDESGHGWVLDTYGTPTYRNDWVYMGNGQYGISGSGPESEWSYQPSPGFFPVDAGNYKTGANQDSYYSGRENDPVYRDNYTALQKGGYFNSTHDLRNDASALQKALAAMAGGTDYLLLLKQLGYDPGA